MKSFKKVLIVLASCVVLGDVSAKASKETGDVYAPTDLSEKMKQARAKQTARRSTAVTEARLSERIDLCESSIFQYSFTGLNVEQEDCTIFYDPVNKECGINFDKYRTCVSFNRNTLFILKDAFEKYEEEFDSQTLSTKRSKTIAKYGKIKPRYYKKQFLKTTDVFPKTSVGYVFVKNSPYFMLVLEPTEKQTNVVDSSKNFKTPKTSIAFNRNQMKTFLEATSQESVDAAIERTLKELNEAALSENEKAAAKAE